MHASKKTIFYDMLCLLLIAQAGLIRMLRDNLDYFKSASANDLIGALFITAIFIWMEQVQKRLIQYEERRYLTLAGFFIAFLMVIRTIKFLLLPNGHFLTRYAWYLYYLPQTFIVLFMFFAVLHIGKPYDEPISRKWKLLYLPAAMIVIGVLTNDFHQLAFGFPDGIGEWENYVHGPLYFISIIWVAVLFASILTVTFVRASVAGLRKKLWIPIMPLALALIYLVMFFVFPDGIPHKLFKSAEMLCIVYMAFMECLILSGLFPSNDSYRALWNASDLAGGILDSDGVIRYKSRVNLPVTPAQIREAAVRAVPLSDNNYLLRSHMIDDGYVYWAKNISDINRINAKLAELGDVLTEENAMLKAENDLAAKRAAIEQKSQLYDEISGDVSDELNAIERLLSETTIDEAAFEHKMKYAAVLTAYIKRRSNLILLSRQNDRLPVGELKLALNESLEYLRFYGVPAHGEFEGDMQIDSKGLLFAYKLFERVVETAIPGASAIIVSYEAAADFILRIEADSPQRIYDSSELSEQLHEVCGTLELEVSDGSEFLTLTFPGGDAE